MKARANPIENQKSILQQPVLAFTTGGCRFYKSSRSGGGGCVAVAWGAEGSIFIGDDKNQAQAPLRFNSGEWQVFVDAVRRGEFDRPPKS